MTRQFRLLCSLIAVLILSGTAPVAVAKQGHAPQPATPEATAVAQVTPESVTWQVENVTQVEIDGSSVTMSPNGAWIAGIGPEFALCIWQVATMEPTCDQAERIPISADSLVWSPDSTAIAFTEDAFMSAYESDIHVYELGASESVNITDDGIEGGLFDTPEGSSRPGDVVPVWSLDSQSLIFARSDFGLDEPTTDLMRAPRAGGEPEFLDPVSRNPYAIYTPMHVLADGSLLYTHASPDLEDPNNGIWVRSPEGELRQVLPGDNDARYPVPVMTDIHERDGAVRIAAYSVPNMSRMDADLPIAFVLDLESGEVTPVQAHDLDLVPWAITFSPDGETFWSGALGLSTASLFQVSGGDQQLIELADGEPRPPGSHARFPSIEWRGENTLFVPAGITRGSYILSMTSSTGETPATPEA
jgi:WD40 repeat protein